MSELLSHDASPALDCLPTSDSPSHSSLQNPIAKGLVRAALALSITACGPSTEENPPSSTDSSSSSSSGASVLDSTGESHTGPLYTTGTTGSDTADETANPTGHSIDPPQEQIYVLRLGQGADISQCPGQNSANSVSKIGIDACGSEEGESDGERIFVGSFTDITGPEGPIPEGLDLVACGVAFAATNVEPEPTDLAVVAHGFDPEILWDQTDSYETFVANTQETPLGHAVVQGSQSGGFSISMDDEGLQECHTFVDQSLLGAQAPANTLTFWPACSDWPECSDPEMMGNVFFGGPDSNRAPQMTAFYASAARMEEICEQQQIDGTYQHYYADDMGDQVDYSHLLIETPVLTADQLQDICPDYGT